MKECSTPPSEAVEWNISWGRLQDAVPTYVFARTAWEAWSKCNGAPAFGSCAANRIPKTPPATGKPPKPLTEAQKRKRAREAIIQPKTAAKQET